MSPDHSSAPGPGTPHGTARNVWTISGVNAGKLNAMAFARITNLIGGSGFDHLIIASGLGVTGKLDGGGGLNILDYSKYTSAVTVNLATIPPSTAKSAAAALVTLVRLAHGRGRE